MIPTANTVRYGAAGGYQNVDVMVSVIRHARIAQEIELIKNTTINGKNRKAALITSINALFRGDKFR